MIFKQKVLKEEKIKLSIIFSCLFILVLLVVIFAVICDGSFELIFTFVSIILLPLFIILFLVQLNYFEWFYIFNDIIEVRCPYGIKNIVYFNNILSIEEVSINLKTRGMEKQFYIINDGRKNNDNFFNINSCYNRKKFNLRIYKTEQLKEFINKSLQIKAQ